MALKFQYCLTSSFCTRTFAVITASSLTAGKFEQNLWCEAHSLYFKILTSSPPLSMPIHFRFYPLSGMKSLRKPIHHLMEAACNDVKRSLCLADQSFDALVNMSRKEVIDATTIRWELGQLNKSMHISTYAISVSTEQYQLKRLSLCK